MLGIVWKSVLVFAGCLVAADIGGVIVVTVVDILPLRFASAALGYAIWFVIGVFCGLYAYNFAAAWASPKGEGDWSERPGARRIGTGVLIVGALVVAAAVWLGYALFWSQAVAGDDYVPDSAPHSIVFLVAVLGAAVMARFFLMPSEPAAKQPDVVS
jgi:H+/Cl- antiporter ClcA